MPEDVGFGVGHVFGRRARPARRHPLVPRRQTFPESRSPHAVTFPAFALIQRNQSLAPGRLEHERSRPRRPKSGRAPPTTRRRPRARTRSPHRSRGGSPPRRVLRPAVPHDQPAVTAPSKAAMCGLTPAVLLGWEKLHRIADPAEIVPAQVRFPRFAARRCPRGSAGPRSLVKGARTDTLPPAAGGSWRQVGHLPPAGGERPRALDPGVGADRQRPIGGPSRRSCRRWDFERSQVEPPSASPCRRCRTREPSHPPVRGLPQSVAGVR